MSNKIIIHNAREHNLKNIHLEIPRDKLVVITGLSGSGKSSLAFDTIYAEGQRRYVESLSSYARQFLGVMEKPDVDYIEGLSPAISIDQKTAGGGPRSTVGTITEIYDYMRLLWARIGTPHCPRCGREVVRQTPEAIVNKILKTEKGRLMVLAPMIKEQKGEHAHIFARLKKEGFVRVRVDGIISDIDDLPSLDKNKKHTIEAVVDRIYIDSLIGKPKNEEQSEIRNRLAQSIEAALKLSEGILIIFNAESKKENSILRQIKSPLFITRLRSKFLITLLPSF